jgi:hypothetical protein
MIKTTVYFIDTLMLEDEKYGVEKKFIFSMDLVDYIL